jgi:amino acid efflux transporter
VSETRATTTTTTPGLTASIGLGQGVALYVSAILGAGVLVLPGQAASLAGPAALLAWGFSCLLGVPLAATFAALATRLPDAGGVSTYAAEAFGAAAGGVTGWWYLIAGSVGQTIVPLTGGYYLVAALGLDQRWAYAFAAAILLLAVLANLAGTRISGRVQIGLAVTVGAVLAAASMAGISTMDTARLTPFAPHGITGVGQAVLVLFFAFAGWEAIAHLAGEFRNPGQDLPRATAITIGIVSVLYLAVAAAVVLTGTYGRTSTDHLAIGTLLHDGLGVGAVDAAAVVAVVISLGTTNAFVASVSRLAYALARDGWLPQPGAHISRRNVPDAGIGVVAAIGAVGLALAWAYNWGTEQIVFIPSILVVMVYLAGTAAAVKILDGRRRGLAVMAFLLTATVLPFAWQHLLIPVAVALAALTVHATCRTRTRT